jgi:hypothetical protein
VEFIRKHYEKLMLIVLMFAFIGSMVYVLDIIRETADTESLKISTGKADQERLNAKDEAFSSSAIIKKDLGKWNLTPARSDEFKNMTSDLVIPPELSFCPFDGCGSLIPFGYMSGKECPFCKKFLPTPPKRKVSRFRRSEDDLDGDGIPNREEENQKLDKDDPNDALYDKDRDGFSNVYEYLNGFKMNLTKSHPPMWYRLILKELGRQKLPVLFKAVNTNNSTDQKKWDIQINHMNPKNMNELRTTDVTSIGGLLTLDGREYQIVRVELKQTKLPTKAGESQRMKDESVIYLEETGGKDRIHMQIGKDVFSSDVKAVFIDCGQLDKEGKPIQFVVGLNQKFTVGNRRNARDTYLLRVIDTKRNMALLVDTKTEKIPEKIEDQMWVTQKGKIPEDMRVKPVVKVAEVSENAETGDESTRGRRR